MLYLRAGLTEPPMRSSTLKRILLSLPVPYLILQSLDRSLGDAKSSLTKQSNQIEDAHRFWVTGMRGGLTISPPL